MGDDAGGYKFGVTASGIPFLAGLLTVDELRRGAIDHILGLALPETLAGRWSYPARGQTESPIPQMPSPKARSFAFRLI
jgi:hypothetical protein